MIQPGTVIKGFVVREHIGSGGFGDVYRVRDMKTGHPFALKLSRSSLLRHGNWGQMRESFVNEISMLSLLHGHGAIAKVYRSILHKDKNGEYLGIVMEFISGIPLDVYIYNKGKLVDEQAVPLFLQVVDAVGYAHGQGVLHRDIKPGNIMVLPRKTVVVGGQPTHPVKMLDFGLAKTMDQTAAVESHSGVSLPYMAPERLAMGARIDVRTDVYSLGATLYEMLTGCQPFRITTFPEALSIIPTVRPPSIQASYAYHPSWLDEVVQRAMAKSPQARYQDCASLAAAVRTRNPQAGPAPGPGPDRRPPSVRPGPWRPPSRSDVPAWDGELPGARGALEWFLRRVLGVGGVFPPPASGVVPGTLARRGLACLIDLFLLLLLGVVSSRLGFAFMDSGAVPVVVFLACLFCTAGCEAWWGASFGKSCLGLRVIPMRHGGGRKVGQLQSGVRTLAKYPALLFFPLQYVHWSSLGLSGFWLFILGVVLQVLAGIADIVCIMESKGGVSLHDAIAKTLVVHRLPLVRSAGR